MDGASSASPQRTMRTAAIRCSGETSLSRKPLAPADSAAYTYWSRSNVVRMMIRTSVRDARMRLVASSPSISGIRMSISTTSGWYLSAAATAAAPSAASATTSMPAEPRISRKPPRTSVWSSAMTTRGASSSPGATLTSAQPRWPAIPATRPPRVPRRRGFPAPRGFRGFQRDLGLHAPAAARPRAGVELPAVDGQPLPEPDQPAPAPRLSAARIEHRRPVVRHVDPQLARPVLDADDGAGLARVLDHVGQPFLHHAVGGQVHPGRQGAVPGDRQLDRQPGGANPLDQRPNLPGIGLRDQCCVVPAGRGQQAEQVPQFAHRGPPAGLDREQCLYSDLGLDGGLGLGRLLR